jgi:hypothetical protein
LFAVITGIIAVWTLINKEKSGKPEYSDFIKIDTTNLVKVTFTNNSQSHYVAPKTALVWFIDSKYDVRKDIITTMKLGLARMEVKMPVASEIKEKIRKRLISEGVHVEVLTEEGKKEFWILTNDNDENSSYFINAPSAEPYIVYVPGFTGDLTDLFKLAPGDWRNKALFRNFAGGIEEIQLKYESVPKDGFIIKKVLNKYEVVDMPVVDSTRLQTYLSLFQHINVENYLVDKQKDSVEYLLKSHQPEVFLSVVDFDKSRSRTIQIYKALPGTKLLYARIVDNGELVTLSPEVFFRLLVRKQWFMDK